MLFNLRFKRRETSPHEGVHPRRRSGEDGPSLRSRKIGIAVGCLFKGRIRRVYFPGQLRKLSLEILKAEVETERAWNIRGSSRARARSSRIAASTIVTILRFRRKSLSEELRERECASSPGSAAESLLG
jgi:hypothetical protein